MSFCITSYDGDYHMTDSLLSLLENQTSAPFEVLVFCSGKSKKDSESTIEIAKTLVPLRKFFLPERKMQSFARNFLAEKAKGEWITFFDVDDVPHPQKIEAAKKVVLENSCDFVAHSYQGHGSFDRIKSFQVYENLVKDPNSTNIICKDAPNCAIHHAHITVRKNCFGIVEFNESRDFYRSEDGKFCQDLLDSGFKGIFADCSLVWYT